MATGEAQRIVKTQPKRGYEPPASTIRTSRESLRNINGGVTKAQQEALTREESRIHKIPVGREETVVIDENGRVNPLGSPMIKSGTTRRGGQIITFSRYDMRKIPENSIMIHNHPGFAGDSGSLATRIGNTFSTADINSAVRTNVKEIRAVAKGYTYSLKRPANGWPRGFDRAFESERKKQWDGLVSQIMEQENRGRLDEREFKVREERANLLARHRAMDIVSRRYGVKYTRVRHNY